MPEMTYTCGEHKETMKGSSQEELAKNIQKHVKDVHKKDMPMEECMKMAKEGSKKS